MHKDRYLIMAKRLLIESWFPVYEVGVEVRRERGARFPPLYLLALWWARRPLTAVRFLLALSCLSEDGLTVSRDGLLRILGVMGDPLKSWAKRKFDYSVAESQNPNVYACERFMVETWGRRPTFADLMAGGGTAPFEAIRLGFKQVVAGEYNPVAYLVLKASLEYPVKYGDRIVRDVKKYGNWILSRLKERLKKYYPPWKSEDENRQPVDYIWVKIFKCPTCGVEIPALKDLWLDKEKGYALYPEWHGSKVKFRVVKVELKRGGLAAVKEGPLRGLTFNIAKGYEVGGKLICPKGHVMDAGKVKEYYSNYIEEMEAKGYRGVHPAKLAAVVLRGRRYVEPTEEMVRAYRQAEEDLKKLWDELIAEELIPLEERDKGYSDRVVIYGLDKFYRLFNARQLLTNAELVRLIREVYAELSKKDPEYAEAVTVYLTLAFGKLLDYNSALAMWNKPRGVIRNTFDTHAYAWTWDFAEFDMIEERKGGYDWTLGSMLEALKGLVKRIEDNRDVEVKVVHGDAEYTTLDHAPEGGFDIIFIDPPYYDNVQYAELSDFFYVWYKLILRDIFPDVFGTPLTLKDEEAVANPVRHGKEARSFYEDKMLRIFRSSYKALRDDGVLILWFAHKAGEAWISTVKSLLEAGFTITAVWSIHSEMDRSLHVSGKAALRSSLVFICRKRKSKEHGWLTDVLGALEPTVLKRIAELDKMGFIGPDLIMGAIGEALRIAGEKWPIKDPEGKLTTDQILKYVIDKASAMAINHVMRKVSPELETFDPETKFYALACYLYRGAMDYDDARRLALSLGVTMGDPVETIAIKTGLAKYTVSQVRGARVKVVELLDPVERVKSGMVSGQFAVDHIHSAMAVLASHGTVEEAAKHIAELGVNATEIVKVFYEAMRGMDKIGGLENPGELLRIILYRICEPGLHEIMRPERVRKTLDEYLR